MQFLRCIYFPSTKINPLQIFNQKLNYEHRINENSGQNAANAEKIKSSSGELLQQLNGFSWPSLCFHLFKILVLRCTYLLTTRIILVTKKKHMQKFISTKSQQYQHVSKIGVSKARLPYSLLLLLLIQNYFPEKPHFFQEQIHYFLIFSPFSTPPC